MTTLVARIAPQRSTQYARLASTLAPFELQLSPMGSQITQIEALDLVGLDYLRLDMSANPDAALLPEFGMLAMTAGIFEYYEQIGDGTGPFLRPIDTRYQPAFPPEMVESRRYRGKTNEMFTQFMLNIARQSSAFAGQPWSELRVCDPLAGGGTTLLIALMFGASGVGIEENMQDVRSTVTFLQQYAQEEGIPCKVKEETLKKLGHRWLFNIGRTGQRLTLAEGDTFRAVDLTAGFKKPQLMVADLPYGIQHHGAPVELLTKVLPEWAKVLMPGGVLVFSWDATRYSRQAMIALVEAAGIWQVFNEPPYNHLAHPVDRVIKRRDVIVARHIEGISS